MHFRKDRGASSVDVVLNSKINWLREITLCSDVAIFFKKRINTKAANIFKNDEESVVSIMDLLCGSISNLYSHSEFPGEQRILCLCQSGCFAAFPVIITSGSGKASFSRKFNC